MSESATPPAEAGTEDAAADAQTYSPGELEAGSDAGQLPVAGEERELSLQMVLDVPVTMTLEVGRTQMSIRDLLKLNQGSVVELDQLADQPMSVLVNGTLIAHGEVVVINEKFGIRLTDVISPEQRVRRLN